ncbi:MAG: DUF167 domain-containing protein [Candidatus Omnitrophica bacterium]|nr:DUF167 domain-containing protein [Candidatus Omnitrophota bacterium]
MKISVRVKPNSKEAAVEKISEKEFVVRVKAPPREGRANDAVIKLLGEYFKVPRSMVKILRGEGGKNKVVEIF